MIIKDFKLYSDEEDAEKTDEQLAVFYVQEEE